MIALSGNIIPACLLIVMDAPAATTAGSGSLNAGSDDLLFPENSTIQLSNSADSDDDLEVSIGGLHDGEDADILEPGDTRWYVAPNGTGIIACSGEASYTWSVTARRSAR